MRQLGIVRRARSLFRAVPKLGAVEVDSDVRPMFLICSWFGDERQRWTATLHEREQAAFATRCSGEEDGV